MATYRITCIVKPGPNYSALEHITHVGLETNQIVDVPSIIQFIEYGQHRFYVQDRLGNTSWVTVVRPIGRNPYIKTEPDQNLQDNLLALNDCKY